MKKIVLMLIALTLINQSYCPEGREGELGKTEEQRRQEEARKAEEGKKEEERRVEERKREDELRKHLEELSKQNESPFDAQNQAKTLSKLQLMEIDKAAQSIVDMVGSRSLTPIEQQNLASWVKELFVVKDFTNQKKIGEVLNGLRKLSEKFNDVDLLQKTVIAQSKALISSIKLTEEALAKFDQKTIESLLFLSQFADSTYTTIILANVPAASIVSILKSGNNKNLFDLVSKMLASRITKLKSAKSRLITLKALEYLRNLDLLDGQKKDLNAKFETLITSIERDDKTFEEFRSALEKEPHKTAGHVEIELIKRELNKEKPDEALLAKLLNSCFTRTKISVLEKIDMLKAIKEKISEELFDKSIKNFLKFYVDVQSGGTPFDEKNRKSTRSILELLNELTPDRNAKIVIAMSEDIPLLDPNNSNKVAFLNSLVQQLFDVKNNNDQNKIDAILNGLKTLSANSSISNFDTLKNTVAELQKTAEEQSKAIALKKKSGALDAFNAYLKSLDKNESPFDDAHKNRTLQFLKTLTQNEAADQIIQMVDADKKKKEIGAFGITVFYKLPAETVAYWIDKVFSPSDDLNTNASALKGLNTLLQDNDLEKQTEIKKIILQKTQELVEKFYTQLKQLDTETLKIVLDGIRLNPDIQLKNMKQDILFLALIADIDPLKLSLVLENQKNVKFFIERIKTLVDKIVVPTNVVVLVATLITTVQKVLVLMPKSAEDAQALTTAIDPLLTRIVALPTQKYGDILDAIKNEKMIKDNGWIESLLLDKIVGSENKKPNFGAFQQTLDSYMKLAIPINDKLNRVLRLRSQISENKLTNTAEFINAINNALKSILNDSALTSLDENIQNALMNLIATTDNLQFLQIIIEAKASGITSDMKKAASDKILVQKKSFDATPIILKNASDDQIRAYLAQFVRPDWNAIYTKLGDEPTKEKFVKALIKAKDVGVIAEFLQQKPVAEILLKIINESDDRAFLTSITNIKNFATRVKQAAVDRLIKLITAENALEIFGTIKQSGLDLQKEKQLSDAIDSLILTMKKDNKQAQAIFEAIIDYAREDQIANWFEKTKDMLTSEFIDAAYKIVKTRNVVEKFIKGLFARAVKDGWTIAELVKFNSIFQDSDAQKVLLKIINTMNKTNSNFLQSMLIVVGKSYPLYEPMLKKLIEIMPEQKNAKMLIDLNLGLTVDVLQQFIDKADNDGIIAIMESAANNNDASQAFLEAFIKSAHYPIKNTLFFRDFLRNAKFANVIKSIPAEKLGMYQNFLESVLDVIRESTRADDIDLKRTIIDSCLAIMGEKNASQIFGIISSSASEDQIMQWLEKVHTFAAQKTLIENAFGYVVDKQNERDRLASAFVKKAIEGKRVDELTTLLSNPAVKAKFLDSVTTITDVDFATDLLVRKGISSEIQSALAKQIVQIKGLEAFFQQLNTLKDDKETIKNILVQLYQSFKDTTNEAQFLRFFADFARKNNWTFNDFKTVKDPNLRLRIIKEYGLAFTSAQEFLDWIDGLNNLIKQAGMTKDLQQKFTQQQFTMISSFDLVNMDLKDLDRLNDLATNIETRIDFVNENMAAFEDNLKILRKINAVTDERKFAERWPRWSRFLRWIGLFDLKRVVTDVNRQSIKGLLEDIRGHLSDVLKKGNQQDEIKTSIGVINLLLKNPALS